MSQPDVNFQSLEREIASIIDSASSLEEIETWFRSQRSVKSVRLAGYLLKSNPPQRDFIVEFNKEDGSTVKKVINIFDLGNQQYKFNKIRDQ